MKSLLPILRESLASASTEMTLTMNMNRRCDPREILLAKSTLILPSDDLETIYEFGGDGLIMDGQSNSRLPLWYALYTAELKSCF
jgi:hypothetical protein